MSWKDVTDMNIFTFTHRVRYLTHSIKKQNAEMKKNVKRR